MKKLLALLAAASVFTASLSGCGGNTASSPTPTPTPTPAVTETQNTDTTTDTTDTATTDEKPDTWIADRHIEGRIFLSNDGAWLPADQQNNPFAQAVKERTGITAQIKSTQASPSIEELTLALAARDVPEFIENYLNHSGRPEASVLFKAAREGMFEDVKPYLADTKVYNQYLNKDFLPPDTWDNIMYRPEFNGAVYMIHMNIDRLRPDTDRKYDGGGDMKIREDIMDALGVKSSDIVTWDDFMELCQKIYDGGFTDSNGRPVYVIGPRTWGGQPVSTLYFDKNWGNGTRMGLVDGKVKHVTETEWAMKQVNAMRELIAKDYAHPELFTMENTRVEEGEMNGAWAIGCSISMHEIKGDYRYVPLAYLNNWEGKSGQPYETRRTGYNTWEVIAGTEKPEEIIKYADFLATLEGKTLWNYGIEGQTFDYNSDGYPRIRQDIYEEYQADGMAFKDKWGFVPNGGIAGYLWGSTDNYFEKDFGEKWVGYDFDEAAKVRDRIVEKVGNVPLYPLTDGQYATSFMSDPAMTDVTPNLDPLLDRNEWAKVLVQAVVAKTEDEAAKILDSYRDSIIKAGFDTYRDFLQQKVDAGENIMFWIPETF